MRTPATDYFKLASTISFPEEELPSLRKRLGRTGRIGTTRISAERGRYHEGDALESDLGPLLVSSVASGERLVDHPYFGELTDDWKRQIGDSPFDYVELSKAPMGQHPA